MEQIQTMYRRDARETSIIAAESVVGDLKRLQQIVMDFADSRPNGFTDEEMNEHFNTHRSTYRARRAELMHKGLIKDSGTRRRMGNNRPATVWISAKFEKQQ